MFDLVVNFRPRHKAGLESGELVLNVEVGYGEDPGVDDEGDMAVLSWTLFSFYRWVENMLCIKVC